MPEDRGKEVTMENIAQREIGTEPQECIQCGRMFGMDDIKEWEKPEKWPDSLPIPTGSCPICDVGVTFNNTAIRRMTDREMMRIYDELKRIRRARDAEKETA